MDDFETTLNAHLADAKASRKLRIKQRFVTFRSLYLLPLVIGMLPGKLLADFLYPNVMGTPEVWHWVIVAYGTAALICPVLYRVMGKDKAFETERVFYTEALKRTLKAKGVLHDH